MMASSIAANGSVRGGLLLVRLSPMALPKTFRFQPHRAQDDALLQVTCTYTDTSGRAGVTTNQVVLSAATVASAKAASAAASAATGAGGAGGCALARRRDGSARGGAWFQSGSCAWFSVQFRPRPPVLKLRESPYDDGTMRGAGFCPRLAESQLAP